MCELCVSARRISRGANNSSIIHPRKVCSRNYPQGGWATFFFRPLHPQDTHGVRAPRPPGHVCALINPPHYGSNMPWPPGQVTPPPPTPRTHCQQNTLPPPDKKVFAVPPEDNFWNSPNTRHDVGLNIGLDLWSQLTGNGLMLSDLLHVETILMDVTNHEILPFISNLE